MIPARDPKQRICTNAGAEDMHQRGRRGYARTRAQRICTDACAEDMHRPLKP